MREAQIIGTLNKATLFIVRHYLHIHRNIFFLIQTNEHLKKSQSGRNSQKECINTKHNKHTSE